MIKIGDKAPLFTLENQKGETVSLSDFIGKKVVLYFYSKDNTSGCTKQALAFAELNSEFVEKNAVVMGMSKDTPKAHASFAEKYNLPFTLISDSSLETLKEYGVWQEKKMCGKVCMGTVRTTVIINEDGYIEKIFQKVKPESSAKDALAALEN